MTVVINGSSGLTANDGSVFTNSSGNVGIGTGSPLGKVHSSSGSSGATPSANGNQFVAENSGNAGITIASGATSLGNIFFADSGDSADGYVQYDQSGRSLRFGTATAERARINSNGTVGIGVAGQSAVSGISGYLSVKNALNDGSWGLALEQAGTSNVRGIGISYGYAPNNTFAEYCYFIDTSATRFAVRSNGGVANYQANDVNLSDRREKTNFAPAGAYLPKICAIPVQTFNYADQNLEQDPGLTLGVVAQDVQAVAPELVMESNWGTAEEPKQRLSIYQTDLQYALMKCIQELKAEVDALKAQLEAKA